VNVRVAEQTRPRRIVEIWLGGVCVLLIAMVVVGGVTRLTGSGLSIVEWRPVTGAMPPLSAEDWSAAFHAYQETPQYRASNFGMNLDEFKGIFLWEYGHRLLGRLLGVAFAVPLGYFAWHSWLSVVVVRRLVVALGLGAVQGGLGWFMVKSGLVHEPDVTGRERLRERVQVEHALAHIAARKGPRARYIGVRRNLFDLRRAASIQNLEAAQRIALAA
jgi:cytochrome c oxidase assembly protein subunit 15